MITFGCPKCGQTYQIKDELAGKSVRCKGCGEVLTIPLPTGAPASRPPRPPAVPPAVQAAAPRPKPASPKPPPPPPVEDEYGLAGGAWDDLPAPEEEPVVPSRTLPGKRRGAAELDRSSDRGEGSNRIFWIIGGAAGVVVLGLVVLIASRGGKGGTAATAVAGGGSPVLTIHREVTQQGIQAIGDLTAVLRQINDRHTAALHAGEAQQAVGKILAISQMTATLAPISAIDEAALNIEWGARRNAALEELNREIARLKTLPDATSALQGAASLALVGS